MAGRFFAVLAALALSGCGGGDSGSVAARAPDIANPTSTPTASPTPAPILNTATVVVDGGPAALRSGSDGYSTFNEPYVSVTLCAPGSTSNCQTVDHVLLDTGSVGLRILAPVLNPGVLAGLTAQTSGSGNPVGECYQYVDSYAFGSVRAADVTIGREKAANIPIQVVADTGVYSTVPARCSSGGGDKVATVKDLGANGILGVGTTATDCGSYCANGGSAAAIYYDCPSGGCSSVIARAAGETAPFQQLPNPVAAFATDNNGLIVTLPSVPQAGLSSVTGTITFGIGTQTNNTLTAANVLPVTTASSRLGPGVLTVTYNGKQLTQSFIDSGSNLFYFTDTNLPSCTDKSLASFYCPTSPTALSPMLTATNGVTASGAFTLYSPLDVANSSTVAPGLGNNPAMDKTSLANSFDFGLPFFLGRSVYTAIEGRRAGNTTGPFYAY